MNAHRPDRVRLIKTISAIAAITAAMVIFVIIRSFVNQIGIDSRSGQLTVIVALSLLGYILVQGLIFRKLNRLERILIIVAYGLIVVSGIFLRDGVPTFSTDFLVDFWNRIGLNPLSFIRESQYDNRALLNNILNVLLFVPLTPFLAIAGVRARWWLVIPGFLALELLQYVMGAGAFDLGDIVLYTVGYLLGVAIWRLIIWKK